VDLPIHAEHVNHSADHDTFCPLGAKLLFTIYRKGKKTMQKRILGKTGFEVSIIGFGGILVSGEEQKTADALVREAIERGVNYFDVAPTYGDAEDRLGPALEPFRNEVYLACKTTQRKADDAKRELHESLKKLRTDYFDVYQLHGMTTQEDFDQVFASGGAMETLIEAHEQGLARFIGFTGHSVEIALALLDRFEFDTILFPVNWVNHFNANFGLQVIAKAHSLGMGCMAIKAMARTVWPKGEERTYRKCWYQPVTDPEETALAVRFTLSEPIATAMTPGHADLFRRALDVGDTFTPLSDAERNALHERAAGLEPIFKLAREE